MLEDKSLLYIVYLFIIYGLASLFIFLLVVSPGLSNKSAGIVYMVKGEARQPFVRRALVPSIIKGVHEILPDRVNDFFAESAQYFLQKSGIKENASSELQKKLKRARGYWDIIILGIIIHLSFLMGFLFMLRYGLKIFYSPYPKVATYAPLLLIFVFPMFYYYPNTIYDYSQLFLFSTGFILLAKRRIKLFYLLLTFAALNKETALLLPLFFLIVFWNKKERKKVIYHFIFQSSICLLVYGGLYYVYRNNPGAIQEFHLFSNIRHLSKLKNYFSFIRLNPFLLSKFGLSFTYPIGINLAVLVPVFACIFYKFREKPSFLRKGLLLIIPLFVMSLLFGFIDEIRVYYEVLPIIFWLFWGTIIKGFELYSLESRGRIQPNSE